MRTYDLRWKDGLWGCGLRGGPATVGIPTRREAIQHFAALLRHNATMAKPLSLRIWNKTNGRISEERTYPRGADPKRSKG